MVVVLERSITDADKERVRSWLASRGFRVREIVGEQETILGAVGIVPVDLRDVEQLPGVARVIPITSPYKLASREFRRTDSVIAPGPSSPAPRPTPSRASAKRACATCARPASDTACRWCPRS
jgi:3-deoxy-7-phosphoheptulonate synthase